MTIVEKEDNNYIVETIMNKAKHITCDAGWALEDLLNLLEAARLDHTKRFKYCSYCEPDALDEPEEGEDISSIEKHDIVVNAEDLLLKITKAWKQYKKEMSDKI